MQVARASILPTHQGEVQPRVESRLGKIGHAIRDTLFGRSKVSNLSNLRLKASFTNGHISLVCLNPNERVTLDFEPTRNDQAANKIARTLQEMQLDASWGREGKDFALIREFKSLSRQPQTLEVQARLTELGDKVLELACRNATKAHHQRDRALQRTTGMYLGASGSSLMLAGFLTSWVLPPVGIAAMSAGAGLSLAGIYLQCLSFMRHSYLGENNYQGPSIERGDNPAAPATSAHSRPTTAQTPARPTTAQAPARPYRAPFIPLNTVDGSAATFAAINASTAACLAVTTACM